MRLALLALVLLGCGNGSSLPGFSGDPPTDAGAEAAPPAVACSSAPYLQPPPAGGECLPTGACPTCGDRSWTYQCNNDGVTPSAPSTLGGCLVLDAGLGGGIGVMTTTCCPTACIPQGSYQWESSCGFGAVFLCPKDEAGAPLVLPEPDGGCHNGYATGHGLDGFVTVCCRPM